MSVSVVFWRGQGGRHWILGGGRRSGGGRWDFRGGGRGGRGRRGRIFSSFFMYLRFRGCVCCVGCVRDVPRWNFGCVVYAHIRSSFIYLFSGAIEVSVLSCYREELGQSHTQAVSLNQCTTTMYIVQLRTYETTVQEFHRRVGYESLKSSYLR